MTTMSHCCLGQSPTKEGVCGSILYRKHPKRTSKRRLTIITRRQKQGPRLVASL
ncbi:hypothetical protein B296_00050915 [Ensete ventricosum]|uniref:Uncharacterized protein n=1 Tax=Ensete ventricosum TaxID=4639 RepID=A0A426X5Q4_ENSVE|nr:hypothetical protein B296_00050915 [Ensete ventricosum]